MSESDRSKVGLIQKYRVERLTPSSRGVDHSKCRYFVLDPQHDPHAVRALAAYAESVGPGPLRDDLVRWAQSALGGSDE